MRIIILLLIIGFFANPAFSQKKKSNKRPGLLGRAYHDITARNNAYFNGNEKMKAIQKSMRDSHKDDFSQIIPIYIDRNPEEAKSAGAELDEIIKKGSKVVLKHEPARWADDGYLIVGKSYFLKADYDNSIKAFQYVITKYKKSKKKSSSGKKGKPQAGNASASSASKGSSSKGKKPMTAAQMKQAAIDAEQKAEEEATQEKIEQEEKEAKTGFDSELYYKEPFKMKLKHKPAIDYAYIWIADNYSYMGKFKEAEAVFTILESKGKFPFRLSDELETAKANLYYLKKDYAKTLEQLTTLTAKIKKYKKKNRYHFIMAQIHEQNKSYTDAVTHYKKSLKGRPKYDMEFAALMSIARLGALDNTMPTNKLKSMLTKMAKDVKNKEYLDQIYFYLAELCLREGDKKCGIDNLKKSIENSTSNNKQKAASHLKLADLYFNDEAYREAQENYAAAVALLDNKYPNYAEIKYRAEVLADLVKQLDIIYEQDSLLKVARLPEKERNKFLDDIIFKKEQEEKAEKEKTDQLNATPTQKSSSQQAAQEEGGNKGDWYFYNPTLKAGGYNEFIKVWGNRKLEDNWRRANKAKDAFDNIDTAVDTAATDNIDASASLDRETLLKNFPISKEAQTKSEDMILSALYEAATIYKSKLSNLPKAIAMFEDILKRYPENKYQGQVYYNLYLLYKENGEMTKSDNYKNLLLQKFPDSPYAKIIADPDYLAKQNQKNKTVEDFYKATFAYYQSGAYDTVISLAGLADSLYKDNIYKPKFDLLEAYAIGKSKDLKTYKETLKALTETYKSGEVNTKAKEILDYLENSETKEVRIQSNVADYDYKPNDGHYFMLVFDNDSIKTTDLNTAIAQWNDVNRSLESLKINSLIIKDNLTLVAVKSFKNLNTAKDYLAAITASPALAKFPLAKIFISIISENNFNLVVRNREVDSYKVFYTSRYSNQN